MEPAPARPARQDGAEHGGPCADACRTSHPLLGSPTPHAQGGGVVERPGRAVAAGRAGHGHPADLASQPQPGRRPHAWGAALPQLRRRRQHGAAARHGLEPAVRGQRDGGGPGRGPAGRGPAAAGRALAPGSRPGREGPQEAGPGRPGPQLPHPQPDGEGAGPGAGLQLGRDRAVQVLQRVVPPRPHQLRPDAGQPAAAAGHRAPAAGPRGQPPLLPAHALRGRLLHGRAEHVADGGEALGRRVQLHRLSGPRGAKVP